MDSTIDTSRWREEGYSSEENCRLDKEAFRDVFGTDEQFDALVKRTEEALRNH